jgi:hypothetical protein
MCKRLFQVFYFNYYQDKNTLNGIFRELLNFPLSTPSFVKFAIQPSLDRQAAPYVFCSMPFRLLVIIAPIPMLAICPDQGVTNFSYSSLI